VPSCPACPQPGFNMAPNWKAEDPSKMLVDYFSWHVIIIVFILIATGNTTHNYGQP
jgi:hypothetical protein